MGGSGGGAGPKPQVQYAEPLDYGALMNAASAAATAQVKQQYKSLIENYPALETLSLGTVDRISGRLGATPQPIYEMVEKKDKRGKVTGYEKVQTGMSEGNQQTADALARVRQGLAIADLSPDAANPTSIESELYRQGERDLALGRSLSPEQIRESQQAARAAFAARGMGTSLGSSAAEILNRDAAATQRERERQGFASAANDQYINNITNRRINLANMYYTGAGNLIAADPYSRALGPGLNYSGATQGNQMSQIGSTYNSANQMAGNVASFNANLLDSRANSALNNWAALRGASMSANATRQAGMMGMIGGIGSGALGGLGFALSDKREKTEIKPLGKSGSILGLKTYSYKYKGDDKKRIGVMAQDVQKVLPEAVTEVEYKGKKRLAIKPAVIGAARTQADMYNQLGSNIGNALAAIGGMYGEFQDKKQGAMALDQAMGMAADEKLISYDTLEKFTQLPWRQKKPVFDLVTATVIPIAANKMKVNDQASIWSQYRNTGGGMPDGGFYVQ